MANGKLEKLLILAFKDSKDAEKGGKEEADGKFEALVNPETFTHGYKLVYNEGKQGQGTSGQQLKYDHTEPEDMTFELLFDSSGLIDGNPRESIAEDIKALKKIIIEFQGDSHEPRHYKIVWGDNAIYKGRVTELNILYKLFSPDGKPLRAVAKVRFISSIEQEANAAKDNRKSPDLTHIRRVKAGDTLPLMCHRIYGDSRYYLQVATFNGLGNFRSLNPGLEIVFPPVDKKNNN